MVKKSKKVAITPISIIALIILVVYCVCILTPILWGVLTSVKDIDDFRKRQLLQKLHDIKWGRLDLETLEKVFAIVCRMTEKKEKDK